MTAGAVATTPSTVLVMVLTALVRVLVVAAFTIGARFTVEAIPFTVSVRLVPPGRESSIELMMFTAGAATPLTVVVRLFAAEVLLTVLTAGAVATTPSTVLVMVLTELVRLLVVAAFTIGARFTVKATPFTVSAIRGCVVTWFTYKNLVYYDLAAVPFLYSDSVYAFAARFLAKKVLFGSDFPLLTLARYRPGIDQVDEKEKRLILYENARRLFGA